LGLAPIFNADEQPFSVASVLIDKKALDRPHDIELLGDLAIIPDKGGSLAIVDVASDSCQLKIGVGSACDSRDD
jgi:hypothetical protein